MKRFVIFLPLLSIFVCSAEYSVLQPHNKSLHELEAAIDRSDNLLFRQLLGHYTLTEGEYKQLLKLAQRTVVMRKRATQSLFSSGKDTVYAAIAAALTCYGCKLAYTSITHQDESAFVRIAKGVFGGLLAHVSLDCFIEDLNGINAYKTLDRARAIQGQLEFQANK